MEQQLFALLQRHIKAEETHENQESESESPQPTQLRSQTPSIPSSESHIPSLEQSQIASTPPLSPLVSTEEPQEQQPPTPDDDEPQASTPLLSPLVAAEEPSEIDLDVPTPVYTPEMKEEPAEEIPLHSQAGPSQVSFLKLCLCWMLVLLVAC